MKRRDFIALGSTLATLSPARAGDSYSFNLKEEPNRVDFIHDGKQLSPREYASLLLQLADEGKIKPDYYSNGGVVEELENKFATLLGKESAVFMPTGTLANHIAVRRLADKNRKVIVQEQSHFYNDSGDCAQTLSGLNLIPLGPGGVDFGLTEVEKIIDQAKKARVETNVGVIAIETPVRRQSDRMFDEDKLKNITDFARRNGIKTHLDGARIFIQAAHSNKQPAQYGAMVDTIYTSLWKCFNAPSGAILAGNKAFTTGLFHERRMFGGSLPAAWPMAAIALYYADGFLEDYRSAWVNSNQFIEILKNQERFKPVFFEKGSHILQLNVAHNNLTRFRESLLKNQIELGEPNTQGFLLRINPTINRQTPEYLASCFVEALKA